MRQVPLGPVRSAGRRIGPRPTARRGLAWARRTARGMGQCIPRTTVPFSWKTLVFLHIIKISRVRCMWSRLARCSQWFRPLPRRPVQVKEKVGKVEWCSSIAVYGNVYNVAAPIDVLNARCPDPRVLQLPRVRVQPPEALVNGGSVDISGAAVI